MPSFVCNRCQETLKKPKLDTHVQRCRGASFSCIDCYRDFKGVEYREHFSCITEAEKYEKKKSDKVSKAGTKRPAASQAPVVVPEKKLPTVEAPASLQDALVSVLRENDGGPMSMRRIKKTLAKRFRKKKVKKFLDKRVLFRLEGSSPVLSLDDGGRST